MNSLIGKLLFLAVFLLFSIPASIVDIRQRRIPNWTTYSGLVVFFALRFFSFGNSAGRIVLEMLAGFLIFMLIRIFTKGKLGMGDIKFASLMAAYNGFPDWFVATGFASILGLIFAVTGLVFGNLNRNSKISFAPFLTAGSIGAYFVDYSILTSFQVWK